MAVDERVTRALAFARQALERLGQCEKQVTIPTEAMGTWISLLRNLESLVADLEAATTTPPTQP